TPPASAATPNGHFGVAIAFFHTGFGIGKDVVAFRCVGLRFLAFGWLRLSRGLFFLGFSGFCLCRFLGPRGFRAAAFFGGSGGWLILIGDALKPTTARNLTEKRADLGLGRGLYVKFDSPYAIDDGLLHIRVLKHFTGVVVIADSLKASVIKVDLDWRLG